MRRAIVASLLLGAHALADPTPAPPAKTPKAKKPRPEGTPTPRDYQGNPVSTTHKEGEYGGVDPGRTPSTTDHPKPARMPPKGTLSWIGFEAKDGGAEIFFQSPGAFEVSQQVSGGTLFVYLSGLSRLGANEWRAIDTRFFDNPISRIEARVVGRAGATKTSPAHGAGVEIRITFKNTADAKEGSYKFQQESDGFSYAYLSFAEGADTKGATIKDPEK
jgi:hypothetical protein